MADLSPLPTGNLPPTADSPPPTADPPPPPLAIAQADGILETKCCFRSCKVNGAELIPCEAKGCKKFVHMLCYQGIFLKKHKDLPALPAGKVACNKNHQSKASKQLAGGGDEVDGGGRKGNWDCDGKNGPDDPNTSVKILIDWWTHEGNYATFCGKNNNGIKKHQFCAKLALKMSNQTSSVRDGKSVLSKIQHIERTFKEAHAFATSETGAGLQESDESTFQDAVRKKCPYYYDLLDIMCDRASSKPKATTYELDNEEIEIDDLSDVTEPSSKKPKRAKKKTGFELLEDSSISLLTKASIATEAKIDEVVRHNKILEEMEEKKYRLLAWKGKEDKLNYQLQLFRGYKELKEEHGLSDEQIIAINPDMEKIVASKKNN